LGNNGLLPKNVFNSQKENQMRFSIASSVLVMAAVCSLHAAPTVRYLDQVFDSLSVTSNILYGSNVNYDNKLDSLKLDLYQPFADTAKTRPLMLFFYGGGFAVGDKTSDDIVRLCRTFAQKGYVTAAPNYRLNPTLSNGQTKLTQYTAMLRGVQDAKAAVRFLRSKKANYKIDDTRIFMGGTSAGAVIGIHCAYWDENEIPSYIDTTTVGGIEGASGTPGVSSAITGVINCWGCIIDSMWLYNNKIPVISFAGTADPTVPYDTGYALGNPVLTCCGSACINRVLTRLGVKSVLKPFIGMGHGMATNDPRFDTILTMSSQFAYGILFGATAVTQSYDKSTKIPDQQRVFQSIAVGRASAGTGPVFSRQSTVYSLNGRVVRVPEDVKKGSVFRSMASEVYVFQPALK
jgi:poly(3-hydroxybutyrate) depolymerase